MVLSEIDTPSKPGKKVPQDIPKKKEPSTDESTQVIPAFTKVNPKSPGKREDYSKRNLLLLHMQSIDLLTKLSQY